jgi:hypothetical protein
VVISALELRHIPFLEFNMQRVKAAPLGGFSLAIQPARQLDLACKLNARAFSKCRMVFLPALTITVTSQNLC